MNKGDTNRKQIGNGIHGSLRYRSGKPCILSDEPRERLQPSSVDTLTGDASYSGIAVNRCIWTTNGEPLDAPRVVQLVGCILRSLSVPLGTSAKDREPETGSFVLPLSTLRNVGSLTIETPTNARWKPAGTSLICSKSLYPGQRPTRPNQGA